MRLAVHFEAKYDKRHGDGCDTSQREVVVKRAALESDGKALLADSVSLEGEKIFSSYRFPVESYNHRMEIVALQVDGVMYKQYGLVAFGIKAKQQT